MDNKVVFLDIDGTILNEDKQIPDSTKESVKLLQEQNINVAIATGRTPQHFQDIMAELNINSYVSFNGSYVVYNGEVIYKRPLNREHLITLEKEAVKREHPMVFLTEKELFANKPDDDAIHESMASLKLTHPPFHATFHHENDIYQALLFVEETESAWYEQHIKQFDFVRWHEKSMDVLPPGGSKAEGIKAMLEKLNIPPKNAIAFGDGLNDLEMLEFVGCGVAMGNAVPEAKEVADMITEHVNHDGIYKGLQHIGLLK
ncbi:Cof subfamily protein (haloacid dehalogenase superfamily) [Evansella vedderi]|uniref:Cof subfamily protein (Haloacid dehalogenase superfamily) n=1 Tax=Evansella vedderi TaxID=38282 RepID=A0ABT9ZT37_9BACI|nr:Cof-type HAD-IIB family hydrolase [Evansella vedderi]MDQ0253886.1 Cof subfamily protein (haloacid dehalogenase superfamily) [Evansella vedderi]